MEAAASPLSNEEEEEEEEYELASSAVDQMPPGFRFHPTDSEIITHYLLNKVIHRRFRAVAIREVDLNKCEPWDLPHKAAKMGENEWFFFFEKESKYPSGTRTNRATASGYWKATGKDREIYNGNPKMRKLVGMKKTLVFYKGRAPRGNKTNWVIHEYRLHGDFSAYNLSHDAKEKWVVCRVFHKKDEPNRIDSFVDRYLVDSPTAPPLPPLTDYSSEKPSSSFATDQITKPSTLMMLQQHHHHNLNSVLPYESSSSLGFQHQGGLTEWCLTNFPINDKPNLRILEPDVYIGGKEPEILCKMEPVSFNNSAISLSRDTGIITELAAACERESESNKACDDLCFSPDIPDMEYSLWSY